MVPDELDARLAQPPHGLLEIVHHEPDVPVVVGGVRDPARERDELVSEVDERHPRGPAPQLHAVEDPVEERERLVDVADLDRDVVDAHEPRHGPQTTGGRAPRVPRRDYRSSPSRR